MCGCEKHSASRILPASAVISGQTFDYTAFGDLLSTGTPTTDYLYTGQQFDAATGLYSLRARYYDPGTGRFNP
ncbi:MAG: RHS repeat-associated core domain-containing protein [bacterium]|nr:RHS repeat-associated core domain-containing protein [bacterium]